MFEFVRKPREIVAAEHLLTPLEIARGEGPAPPSSFAIFDDLKRRPPKRFGRRMLAPSAALYSANLSARTLIVAFCGKARRPMVPVSVLLQSLDDASFDLLLLIDDDRRHFDRGAPGHSSSLPELAQRTETLASRLGHVSLVTFGTSMGGFPALRAGRMLRAARAISVGGRFAWHVDRLAKRRNVIRAFDPLCACVRSETPCFNVYARDNTADAKSAALLSAMLPEATSVPLPFTQHNVIDASFKRGELEGFLARLFDPRLPLAPDGFGPVR